MDQRLRDCLRDVCSLVERRFPSAMCAFEGFAQDRMPTEDEDAVIEVFFAPVRSGREIARATHEKLREIWRTYRVSVAVVAHYPDDTLHYYADDVLALWRLRGLASFLDASGFGETATGNEGVTAAASSVSSNSQASITAYSIRSLPASTYQEGDTAPWCEASMAEVHCA